jgi:hypothetical protein
MFKPNCIAIRARRVCFYVCKFYCRGILSTCFLVFKLYLNTGEVNRIAVHKIKIPIAVGAEGLEAEAAAAVAAAAAAAAEGEAADQDQGQEVFLIAL